LEKYLSIQGFFLIFLKKEKRRLERLQDASPRKKGERGHKHSCLKILYKEEEWKGGGSRSSISVLR
jgi:hypothetical protein